MVHGDDSGLVIPPRIAPVQTMVIPIAQHKEGVLDKANELLDTLKPAGYKAKIDDSDKAPGWKFSGQEILGIPTHQVSVLKLVNHNRTQKDQLPYRLHLLHYHLHYQR